MNVFFQVEGKKPLVKKLPKRKIIGGENKSTGIYK